MAAAATAAAARATFEAALRSGRSRVVSSTSDAGAGAGAMAAAAAAGAADAFGASGAAAGSGLGSGAGLRDARSAAVVSVVSDAATRWVCFFVVAAEAARLRAAGVLAAEEVRAARAVLAASPRALAAFDDAAREAAVRFDAGFSASSTGVGFASAALDAAFVALEAAFAAVLRAGRGLRAGFGGAWSSAWSPEAPVAAPAAVAGFAAGVEAPLFAADGLDAPDLGARGFDAGFGVASASVDVLDEPAAPVLPARFAVLRGARGATEDPRSADTPVPVPSGASSFCSERETEVTQTTYQSGPSEPSCDVPRRRGSCAFPERGITIPLRPHTLRGARRWGPISCNPA